MKTRHKPRLQNGYSSPNGDGLAGAGVPNAGMPNVYFGRNAEPNTAECKTMGLPNTLTLT